MPEAIHTPLLFGAVREDASGEDKRLRSYNTAFLVDAQGKVLGTYDKTYLLAFGEYLPFQRLLERFGLMQLTKVVGGFLSGDRRRAMDVSGAPKMLPLICYEAIFPGAEASMLPVMATSPPATVCWIWSK